MSSFLPVRESAFAPPWTLETLCTVKPIVNVMGKVALVRYLSLAVLVNMASRHASCASIADALIRDLGKKYWCQTAWQDRCVRTLGSGDEKQEATHCGWCMRCLICSTRRHPGTPSQGIAALLVVCSCCLGCSEATVTKAINRHRRDAVAFILRQPLPGTRAHCLLRCTAIPHSAACNVQLYAVDTVNQHLCGACQYSHKLKSDMTNQCQDSIVHTTWWPFFLFCCFQICRHCRSLCC